MAELTQEQKKERWEKRLAKKQADPRKTLKSRQEENRKAAEKARLEMLETHRQKVAEQGPRQYWSEEERQTLKARRRGKMLADFATGKRQLHRTK